MNVFLVTHSHKHGVDHAVAKTELGAYERAARWAHDSAAEEFGPDKMDELDKIDARLRAAPKDVGLWAEYIYKFQELAESMLCPERIEVKEVRLIE